MIEEVAAHYSGGGGLAEKIAESLRSAGKDLNELKAADLATVDEFHIRGRKATLELAEQMNSFDEGRLSAAISTGRRNTCGKSFCRCLEV